MTEDHIVDEVRRARDEYARQFAYDLDAIYEDLRKKQESGSRRVVSFPPKRPQESVAKT